jgi:hypothetical protein
MAWCIVNYRDNCTVVICVFEAGIAQTVQRLGYGLDDRDSILGFFSSQPLCPDRLRAHPASYTVGAGGKADWA